MYVLWYVYGWYLYHMSFFSVILLRMKFDLIRMFLLVYLSFLAVEIRLVKKLDVFLIDICTLLF